jgi:phosphatidylinositol glycan class V
MLSLAKSLSGNNEDLSVLSEVVPYITSKLVKWDAIYFVQTARRGYVFEQEWAFGWGFSRLIKLFTQGS